MGQARLGSLALELHAGLVEGIIDTKEQGRLSGVRIMSCAAPRLREGGQ